MIDITPGSSILHAMRSQPLNWHTALGELVDNSFDADATFVKIEFCPKRMLCVSDDGKGCDDVVRMLRLGDHYHQPTTSLGRYGVGLKDASCWLWGETTIMTRRSAQETKVMVNWSTLEKSGSWQIPDPVVQPTSKTGTTIVFRNIHRSPPSYDKLASDLSFTFAPALRAGRQITLHLPRRKKLICSAWIMPDLVEIVQDSFEVNGKCVRLTAGVVSDDAVNAKSGFNFCYGHRIIMNTAFGAKGRNVSRICATVELDRAWTLSKNKTEIVDTDQEALQDAIWERCQDIIESSSERAMALNNNALCQEVSTGLQTILGSAKKTRREQRSCHQRNPDNAGVTPKETGSKRRRAQKSKRGAGSVEDAINNAAQVRMEWKPFDHNLPGEFDIPGNVVALNSNHPRMKFHERQNNTDALIDNCIQIIAWSVVTKDQRDKFPAMRDLTDYMEASGHLLATQMEEQPEMCSK